jgi:hypothetical protein
LIATVLLQHRIDLDPTQWKCVIDRSREGLWMPAPMTVARHTPAGVRKPSQEPTAGWNQLLSKETFRFPARGSAAALTSNPLIVTRRPKEALLMLRTQTTDPLHYKITAIPPPGL